MSQENTAPVAENPVKATAKARKAPAKAKQADSGLERRMEAFAAKTEERIEALSSALEGMADLLKRTIDASDHRPTPVQPPVQAQHPYQPGQAVPHAQYGNDYFPPSFREIVDRELGTDFEARLIASSGGDCVLEVFSPPQWDTRGGEEKALYGPRDRRCGVVHRATDVADVTTWCKRFAANIRQTYPHFAPNPFRKPMAPVQQ